MTAVLLLDRPASLVDGMIEASPLDTTRREFITGVGAAALAAAFLAACGEDDDEPQPTSASDRWESLTDVEVGNVDLDVVTSVGEAFGEIDIEKLASLKPDLMVTLYYGGETVRSIPEEVMGQIEEDLFAHLT